MTSKPCGRAEAEDEPVDERVDQERREQREDRQEEREVERALSAPGGEHRGPPSAIHAAERYWVVGQPRLGVEGHPGLPIAEKVHGGAASAAPDRLGTPPPAPRRPEARCVLAGGRQRQLPPHVRRDATTARPLAPRRSADRG